MTRVARSAAVAVAALLALAACGHGNAKASPPPSPAPAGASPGASGSAGALPVPSGSASGPVVIEFTVDGAGPYQIGDKLTDLQANPGLGTVTAGANGCPQTSAASGTGLWQSLQFAFRGDGSLYLAINKSPSVPTPSGAWLGTSLAQLKTIYAGVTNEALTASGRSGFLVTTVDGHGVLFLLSAQGTVVEMLAADAAYLKSSFQHGTTYC